MTPEQAWPGSGATHRDDRRSEANLDVRVVPMTTAHIDELMPLEREMFGTEAWTRNGYRSELADGRHRHYVAAVDVAAVGVAEVDVAEVDPTRGSLLGWAGVMVIGTTAEILTVGVVPAARRRGIARLLVADLLAEAVRRGADEAFLEVRVDNDAARTLYATAGFAEIGLRRGYYDAGRVDAVTMRRDLRLPHPTGRNSGEKSTESMGKTQEGGSGSR